MAPVEIVEKNLARKWWFSRVFGMFTRPGNQGILFMAQQATPATFQRFTRHLVQAIHDGHCVIEGRLRQKTGLLLGALGKAPRKDGVFIIFSWFSSDFRVIDGDLMVIDGDLMVIDGDLTVIDGDLMVI